MPTISDCISIIICSIDEKKFAAICRNFEKILEHESYEIIGIHDAKSLCEGYNRGAHQSSGRILIFCHDDIEIVSPDFANKIREHLENNDVVGVVGTSRLTGFNWMMSGQPHIHGVVTQIEPETNNLVMLVFGAEQMVIKNIQALDGLFIATKHSVWEQLGFDEETFDAFHGYDLDFTFRAFLAGFQLAVCTDIAIIHQSIGAFGNEWYEYQQRFMNKHHVHLLAADGGLPEKGAIHVSNKEEILEMMQPRVLQHVTNDIRALAETKNASMRKKKTPAIGQIVRNIPLLGRIFARGSKGE